MGTLGWLFLGLVAVATAALFFWLGRHNAPTSRQIRELEEKLANSHVEMGQYRQEVNRHFERTAELVGDVTAAYRNLYHHLAEDSQRLAPGPAERLLESMGERALLERRGEEPPADYAPDEPFDEVRHAEPEPEPEPEPSEHSKAESVETETPEPETPEPTAPQPEERKPEAPMPEEQAPGEQVPEEQVPEEPEPVEEGRERRSADDETEERPTPASPRDDRDPR